MTPIDLFICGFVVLAIMMVLLVLEAFIIDDHESTMGAWIVTAGIGSFIWIVLWAGAIVLWLISG